MAEKLYKAAEGGLKVVFASPFPALMAILARRGVKFAVLHNDKRLAKEVPDGKGGVKIIHTVAPDGWVIVE